MLEVLNINKSFGGLKALKNVSFRVEKNSIMGLIGPNGSGKTTLFNIISGYLRPNSGKVIFMGKDITSLPPHKICKFGIARTFQIPRPFLEMSVIENVMTASLYGADKKISTSLTEATELLKLVGLREKKEIKASNLNVCERKLLEVARALATDPKLILLDEPLSGLNPREIQNAKRLIQKIRDDLGISIIWVEHILKALKNTVDMVVVLNYGEKIAEGVFTEITCDKRVIEAYLGAEWVMI
ncbi:MAG: ABC transporter ATP-binding protein [Candidatus Caldarchaeum sp.]|nr:ABC transporter ATP-binding protein [Candidatus Caldarchaeum sp.]MDW7977902.1 ABC transporter ATP-binding protein [Candidatus Caldarchaeum sp.]